MKFNKILAILIITIIAAAVTSKRRRLTTTGTSNYSIHTGYNDAGSGSIFYLDRHYLTCGNNALTFFELVRNPSNSGQIRYLGSCLRSSALSGSSSAKYTSWNDKASNEKKSVNFLDRHTMNCGNGKVITGFGLRRSGNRIRYQYGCVKADYVCCKQVSSVQEDMGDKSNYYLDRQEIGVNKATYSALQRIRLRTKYDPDRMWYEFTKCQLTDMDAKNKEGPAKTKYNNLSKELSQNKIKLDKEKKRLNTYNQKHGNGQEIFESDVHLMEIQSIVTNLEAKVNKLTQDTNSAKTTLDNLQSKNRCKY